MYSIFRSCNYYGSTGMTFEILFPPFQKGIVGEGYDGVINFYFFIVSVHIPQKINKNVPTHRPLGCTIKIPEPASRGTRNGRNLCFRVTEKEKPRLK